MNSLQTLRKERNRETSEPVTSLQNPEASRFEGLSAPSQPRTLLSTPGGQALGSRPLLSPALASPYPTVSRVPPCLVGPLCPQLSEPLPAHKGRGWSPPTSEPPCSQRVGAAGRLGAASQQQAGASIQQAEVRRSSQSAAGRQ